MSRWLRPDRLSLLFVIVLVVAFFARPSSGQNNDEERISDLETRVATLEAAVFGTAVPSSETKTAARASNTPSLINQTTIGGSYIDQLPEGDPGELSVIAYKVDEFSSLPFVLKNNTDHTVIDPNVSATVRDSSGSVIGILGSAFVMSPHVMNPGEISIGIFLSLDFYPANATMEFEITESTPEERAENPNPYVDLKIADSILYQYSISGEVTNLSNRPFTGGNLYIACFSSEGDFSAFQNSWLIPDKPVDPGEDFPFKVSIYSNCERFIVTALGAVDE